MRVGSILGIDEIEDVKIESVVIPVVTILKAHNLTFAQAIEVLERSKAELQTHLIG